MSIHTTNSFKIILFNILYLLISIVGSKFIINSTNLYVYVSARNLEYNKKKLKSTYYYLLIVSISQIYLKHYWDSIK